MWSFFSRDPAKDFTYEIGDEVDGLADKSLWSLHDGKHKTTGAAASVFVFDVKGKDESQIQIAKASFKKIKTLRHPNLLTFLDGLESEKVLYIATEHIVPLEKYLQDNEHKGKQNELAISWGLHQLAKGLSFLVNDCNLIHNNVCLSSVFVDVGGEWKLGGLDYMYPSSGADSNPPLKLLPFLAKYDPPEKTASGRKPSNKWSTDMWGFGCLIWEVFNGTLVSTGSLKSLGKIAKSLVPHYCELVGANPKSRPNPATFIEHSRKPGGFMDNKFVETMLFLEEIQIKEPLEKTQFFNSLSNVLDTFPESFCKQKILPQLLHAFEYGNAGSAVLTPLFKLGKLLDAEDYQRRIVPCVVKLFSSNDRATRVKLLQQVGIFVEYLNHSIVNDKIYPSIVPGFMDTNPLVREHTIKSMLHLACKLNYKNLNDDLLKHFARLQSKDDQGGIRTNTTVCLGKIACYLNPQVRRKVLTSAYLRAIKDPFPAARQAGILAMAATHNFFPLQESANRLLPALCAASMDPDRGVRDQVFKTIKCFLGKLEKASTNPELIPEMEKDVNTGGSAAGGAAGWAGWAMSGMTNLTSKIYKGKDPNHPVPARSSPESGKPVGVSDPKTEIKSPAKPPPRPAPTTPPQTSVADTEAEGNGDGGGGWNEDGWQDGDGWDDPELTGGDGGEPTATTDGWDDDNDDDDNNWGSLEEDPQSQHRTAEPSIKIKEEDSPWGVSDFSPVEDTGLASSANYNWGNDQDSNITKDPFFSALLSDDKKKSKMSLGTRPSSGSKSPALHSSSNPKSSTGQPTRGPSQASSKTSSVKPGGLGSGGDSWGGGGGWDKQSPTNDWGASGGGEWDSLEESLGISKQEEAKRKREEKRLQRQREIEEKRAARQAGGSGALKLGSKKLLD